MTRQFKPNPLCLAVACVSLFIGSGCDSSSGAGDGIADAGAMATLPSDADMLAKVYAANVSVPPDFFIDPATSLTTPYTLFHVKSTDVDPAQSVPFELCTDDFTDAMAWSDVANAGRIITGELLTTAETDEYFEFVRALDGLTDWTSFERVFKCTYVDRSGADLRLADGPAGRINRLPLTATELKRLVEYLWQFSNHNNPGHAVLSSTSFTTPATLGHTLTLAELRRAAGATVGCDEVSVADWTFEVDSQSGVMTTAIETLMRFDSRDDGGSPERCAP